MGLFAIEIPRVTGGVFHDHERKTRTAQKIPVIVPSDWISIARRNQRTTTVSLALTPYRFWAVLNNRAVRRDPRAQSSKIYLGKNRPTIYLKSKKFWYFSTFGLLQTFCLWHAHNTHIHAHSIRQFWHVINTHIHAHSMRRTKTYRDWQRTLIHEIIWLSETKRTMTETNMRSAL